MGTQSDINRYVGVYIVVQYFDDFIYRFGAASRTLSQFDYDYKVYSRVYDLIGRD